MAGSILMGYAGPHDLVYGFSPKSVVERLTSENWRRKAVMRRDKHGELYIWVSRGKKEEDGKKDYSVNSGETWTALSPSVSSSYGKLYYS